MAIAVFGIDAISEHEVVNCNVLLAWYKNIIIAD